MHEHQEAVEADLLRYYQLDLLADLAGPRLSWRRLGVLIRQLPREAATTRAAAGEAAAWGDAEHLLASIVDVLNAANWQRSGKQNAPRPKPLPRPGVKKPGETTFGTKSMSIDEYKRHRARRAARRR